MKIEQLKKLALPSKLNDHYSNILLLAPDNEPLATIPDKRARWYKKRGIVEELGSTEDFSEVLRLLVEPKARSSRDILPLENRCVVCGKNADLSAHHIIPRAIRVYFPDDQKSHSHQWVVLLCQEHHLAAEKLARVLYEKRLQEAISIVHKEYSDKFYYLAKEAYQNGTIFDHKPYTLKRKKAVKEAHETCARGLIESFGGIEATKQIFKNAFLRLEPKYLPQGFLSDDWNK